MKSTQIQVCAGAGCKAWDSEKMAAELNRARQSGCEADHEIKMVPCMRKCGGGVTIKSNACEMVKLKFRTTEAEHNQYLVKTHDLNWGTPIDNITEVLGAMRAVPA